MQSAVSCWRVVTRDGDTRHVMDTLYSVLIVSTVHRLVFSNVDIDENFKQWALKHGMLVSKSFTDK